MKTLPEFMTEALSVPRERAFAERLGAPSWTYTSSTRMLERAGAIAHALREAGLEAGDRVALLSQNRVDWLAAHAGVMLAGCVVVPIFPTLALDQAEYIFRDSGAKLAFVETAADAARLRAACPSAPRFVVFDGSGDDGLASFEASGAEAARRDPAGLAGFTAGQAPDDLATLIYTSGTTGNPKGVMLTHRNSTFTAETGAAELLPAAMRTGGSLGFAVLPFAHIYEFNNVLGLMHFGLELSISQPDYLLADLASARPQMLALVPRIFERVLAGIEMKAKASSERRARLVRWALAVGRDYMAATLEGGGAPLPLRLRYAVAKRLVLSKIKQTVGLDRVAFITSGSAPLHRDIALKFAAMGVPICEGYGLTETSPVLTFNRHDAIKYGSVGQPLSGVELRIAADGEILARGPNVMKGYYNLPGEQPFTEDGFFMTGDIGEIDRDGYLFITDRKKELIKTSAGKYVAPGRVEAALKRSTYIGQCFVIGDGRAFPVALVTPNWDLVRLELGIGPGETTAQIAAREDVRALVTREVTKHSADLGSFEQVRRAALLPRDLTIEDGELSPTLKIKRRVVERKYAEIIESAYAPSAR